MEQAQARKLVKETFTQKFDKAQFLKFIRELVNHLDESEGRRKVWAGTLIKRAFADKVHHYERLGTYTDPHGDKLDALVIYLTKETTLERGRTFLRNFVADYLTTGHGQGKEAVLAAFISPDAEDWRFSYIKLEYALEQNERGLVIEKKELTPARRYSFLVGSNERSHTAQKQFLSLLENDQSDPPLEELEKAFDIEKVTKEFFARYKELFEKLCGALEQLQKQNKRVKEEFDAKGIEVDDFAKKLLGQIVFLYFLQKKGWFGVERDAAWGTGNKHFLRHLFDQRLELAAHSGKSVKSVNFFNDILEPLFYEALAIERTANYYSRFHCKIPFLNGGLFEPLRNYDWVHVDTLLPDAIFSNNEMTPEGDKGTGILDVFDRYNFTVNEAEPLEKEVAVDPEMLGKVFENLLPENIRHKAGTYYTPRNIVHYMCQQGLINYLTAHLADVPVERRDIETLIRVGERYADFEASQTEAHKDKLLPKAIRENARRIDRLLEEVTVCDPAIGSGAFPVGMMQEIVRARLTLAAVPGMPHRSPYDLKRHAIQSSLYGVDYDPGAVEIAKLRLWLSLVVDEDDIEVIKPLPNLDYRIMQGNSLLEEFQGVKLLDERLIAPPQADIEAQRAALNVRINELQSQFFDLHQRGNRDQATRRAIEKEIEKIKKERKALDTPAKEERPAQRAFSDIFSEAQQKLDMLKKLHQEFFDLSSPEQKRQRRAELEKLEWEFMEATLSEQGNNEALRELQKHRRDNRKDYFLWKLHFVEVFQEKGGFDVVVANPPYVRQEEIKELKPALKRNYTAYTGTADLYVYFYERSLRLLNPKGTLAFITSNKYFRAGYGEKLRELLGKNTRLDQVIDFGDAPVFEAIAYASIIVLQRQPVNGNHVRVLNWQRDDSLETFERTFLETSFNIPQTELTPNGWRLESPQVLRLIDEMQCATKPLTEYIKGRFYSGIKLGLNEAFIVDDATRKGMISSDPSSRQILKPFLRGKDVKRWCIKSANLYMCYVGWDTDIKLYPAIHAHLLKFKEPLMARPEVQEGRHPWYALSRYAADYWQEFEHPKIVFPDIAQSPQFAWDETGSFLGNTLYLMPTEEKWLLGLLNSKIIFWFYRHLSPQIRGGFVRYIAQYVSQIPVPPISQLQQAVITKLVNYILFIKREGLAEDESLSNSRDQLMIRYFEQLIDAIVYELFLTDELHQAGKHFFEPLMRENLPDLKEIKGDKLATLRSIFERLFDKDHIIRQNLFFLDTLESVRIIEGKA